MEGNTKLLNKNPKDGFYFSEIVPLQVGVLWKYCHDSPFLGLR